MRLFNVCGLGNGLVDVLIEIPEEELVSLSLEKGTMRLVDSDEQGQLLQKFINRPTRMAGGGSVANSIIALSQLGGRGAFICSLGDDQYGQFYREEFNNLGIRITTAPVRGASTGTSISLITPDSERTMRTNLGASALLGAEQVSEELIRQSEWLFIEGYVFANPQHGQHAIEKAITYAKKHQTKVAITISEAFIVNVFGEKLKEAIKQADFIFANESEACALSGTTDYRAAFAVLKDQIPGVAITAGAQGALIRYQGVDAEAQAVACKPVDLTGAGDMFAGTVLACLTHGYEPAQAAKAGCHMAKEVITRYGARLPQGAREAFKCCMGKNLIE